MGIGGDINLVFDGRDVWQPPKVFSFQPRLREGDLCNFGLGGFGNVFAVRPEALEHGHLAKFLESAGELLPLPYEGREFTVLNITECFDALDRERTVYREPVELDEFELAKLDEIDRQCLEEDDLERVVDEPIFRLDRLRGQLFKVPETAVSKIYYWERSVGGADEQPRRYCDREGLTGLVFREFYSTESAR